jgi:NAD(P)H dehydrogenase (quinone)
MASPTPVDQLVVLAHPDPNSFCASIAHRWQERARKHHQTCGVRDLYHDDFDPVLKANEQPGKAGYAPDGGIIAEQHRLEKLNVLVFVYPIWFGTPPAMLKGYLERVVGSGISFAAGTQHTQPLANVRLVQISTAASSGAWLNEQGIPSALHTIFDDYIAKVFGARNTDRLHLDSVVEGMGQDRAAQLAQVEELADRVGADANAERWDRVRAGFEGKDGQN